MKISIIIPVYNVAPYLMECLDCVLHQSYRRWEAICVNDGSTDNSLDILQAYAALDQRFRIISQPNAGLSAARNTGMQYASGDYVIFLDSDDIWNGKYFLECLANQANLNHPDMILFGQARFTDNTDIPLQPMYSFDEQDFNSNVINVFHKLYQKNKFPVSAWSKLIKYEVLKNVEFTPNLLGEDMDWIQRLLPLCQTIEGNNDVWYLYRERKNSITTTFKRKNAEDFCWILETWKQNWERSSSPYRHIYLGYLACLYVTLLYKFFLIRKEDRNILKSRILELSNLLQYSCAKKSNRIKLLKLLLGKHIMLVLSGLYGYYRQSIH